MSLLDHEQGIYGEADLELPVLRAHPAILRRQRAEGVKRFQDALVRLLREIVVLFREPIEESLNIHFAFTQASRDLELEARREEAAIAAGARNYRAYTRDVGGKKSLFAVTLARLEERIHEFATVEPAALPGEPSSFGQDYVGPHRVTVARGHVVIEDMISLAACDRDQSAHHELLLEFERDLRADRPDPAEWPLLRAQLLPVLVRQAEESGREFRDERGLDLTFARSLPETAQGQRRYQIGVSETNYHKWAATANCLDRKLHELPEVVEQLGSTKLRDVWRCNPVSLEDLARQVPPALMGVVVVVVTEDQVVVLERQRMHYVATPADNTDPRRYAHFVGEGMTAEDKDPVTGRYSPERAALRGCEEELGLTTDNVALTPTAVILDTKRCQPIFCFLGRSTLPITDLEERMQFAQDRRETVSRIVTQLPASSRDKVTRSFLAGRDHKFVLASNHAEAALLHALYYLEGRTYVREQLSKMRGLAKH